MSEAKAESMLRCADRAACLAAKALEQEWGRKVRPVTAISATACMVGLLGTTMRMLASFGFTCGGEWASCTAPFYGKLASTLGLGAFGLAVSLFSYLLTRYLGCQIEKLSFEMHVTRLELTNRLSLLSRI